MNPHLRNALGLALVSILGMGCAQENEAESDPAPGDEGGDTEQVASTSEALSIPCTVTVPAPLGNQGYAGAVYADVSLRCYSAVRITLRMCLQEYRLGGSYATVACDPDQTFSLDLSSGTRRKWTDFLGMSSGTYRTRMTINGTNYYSRGAWCNTYI